MGCHSFLQEIFPTQGSNPGRSCTAGRFFAIWPTSEAHTSSIVIIKYWQYSLCCTTYPCSLFSCSSSSLYLLIPYSCLAPPPTPNLYLWVCFSFLVFICFSFQIPSISGNIQFLSFFVWVTSLSVILSRSIHVVANDIFHSVLWLSNIPFYTYTVFLSTCLLTGP